MEVFCVWARQQEVKWIASATSAHYWKMRGANWRWRIICWKIELYWNEHNWLLHDECTTEHHKCWEVYVTWQIISTIVPWCRIPDLKWYLIIWWSRYRGCRICWKKATTYEGKEKRLNKRSTMVSTINVSAYICLKYVQLVRKTVGGLRNNNRKPIDIHHNEDRTNLVDSAWKFFVFCAKQQQVTWITSTISAHYWKMRGANSKWRIIFWEIDLYWEWAQLIITWWVYNKTSQVLRSLLHLANYQHISALTQDSRS